MTIRRQTRPDYFWRIWTAIKNVHQQKLFPDAVNILENMPVHLNMQITEEQLAEHLELSSHEQLLIAEDLTFERGPRKGQKIRIYKIPEFDVDAFTDDNDWYCYYCHLGGEISVCSLCPRVFHLTCHSNSKIDETTNGTNQNSSNNITNGQGEKSTDNTISAFEPTEIIQKGSNETLNEDNADLEIKNGIERVSQKPFASPTTIPESMKNERESFDADTKVSFKFIIFYF